MKLVTGLALALACGTAAEIVVNRVVDDFPWSDPFGEHSTPPGFEAPCEAVGTFRARQYRLSDLQKPEPQGLKPWANALKHFFGGRPFPGSWDGVDEHGTKRDVILMNYTDVPEAARRWIEVQQREKQDGAWLFGVYHKNKEGIKIKGTATPRPRAPTATATPKDEDEELEIDAEAARLPPDENLVVLFAAGALYHVLPLWVAEGSSACRAEMLDLARYGTELKDGSVAAWVVEHTQPDAKADAPDVTFKVKAQLLRETEAGRKARLAREVEEAEASVAAAAFAKKVEASASEAAEAEASKASSQQKASSETSSSSRSSSQEKESEETAAVKDEL